jgi:hypothetical protein
MPPPNSGAVLDVRIQVRSFNAVCRMVAAGGSVSAMVPNSSIPAILEASAGATVNALKNGKNQRRLGTARSATLRFAPVPHSARRQPRSSIIWRKRAARILARSIEPGCS